MVLTVVELREYLKKVERLFSEIERDDIVNYLAVHPRAGVVIQGTGGIRKLRWRREGTGKSGGVRIIYYYHDEIMPLYLLTVFRKNEKDNLTKAEQNDLAKLVKVLTDYWRKK
jgi:hypothetical protein